MLRNGVPIRFERAFVTVGRHIEVSAARVEPASRRQVSVLFRDITERKRAEARLRESDEQFRILAEAIPNHVWSGRPDGTLTWFNAQTYDYTGLAPGLSKGWTGGAQVIHPEDLPAAAAEWSHALATGTVYQHEMPCAGRTGISAGSSSAPSRSRRGRGDRALGRHQCRHRRGQARAVALERLVAERTADRNPVAALRADAPLHLRGHRYRP